MSTKDVEQKYHWQDLVERTDESLLGLALDIVDILPVENLLTIYMKISKIIRNIENGS